MNARNLPLRYWNGARQEWEYPKPYEQLSGAEKARALIEELDAEAERRTRYTNDPIDGLLEAAARMIEELLVLKVSK